MDSDSAVTLEHFKHKCRVCLAPSNQMIALTCKLEEENEQSPQIGNALESIFSIQVNSAFYYPEGVCFICYKSIKASYALKTTFCKSQDILEKYFSVLHLGDNFKDTQNGESPKVKTESLTDFVILQVTEDDEEEQTETKLEIKIEDLENIAEEIVSEGDTEASCPEDTVISPGPNKYIAETVNSESSIRYECPLCTVYLSSAKELEEHVKTTCKIYKLQCFSSSVEKIVPIKMQNSNKLECDKCDKVFDNVQSRSYHLRTKHSMKRFACKICGKAFYFRNSLITHIDTHTKDKCKEICPECGKTFHYKGGLYYHMKIHRNERNYMCTYCSARFLNISGLKKHVRIHTGEKPYQCEYCGRSFLSGGILSKHTKTHTGHRPHICTYCDKGFISSYNLSIHKASHSGNNPCNVCGKSYLNDEVLKLHLKFKHNIKDITSLKTDDSE